MMRENKVARPMKRRIRRSLKNVGKYILSYFGSAKRSIADLVEGIPALLVIVAVMTITGYGYYKQAERGGEYWRLGESSLAKQDFRASEVFLQKALKLKHVDRQRVTLAIAQGYEQQGDLGRAAVIMDTLAPMGDIGVPEAHLFMASRLAGQNARGEAPDLDVWGWHIKHASEGTGGMRGRIAAQYALARGDLEAAVKALEGVASDDPTVLLNLAMGKIKLGKLAEAASVIEKATEYSAREYERRPENVEVIQLYTTALIMGERFEDAESLLIKASKYVSDPSLTSRLVEVYLLAANQQLVEAQRQLESSSEDTASRESIEKCFANAVSVLMQALKTDPNNPQTLGLIGAIGKARDVERAMFRSEIMKFIAEGQANSQAFFTLGMLEGVSGNLEDAIDYTRQALALTPESTGAANNLAMFLILKEMPNASDLDDALDAINRAIEKEPLFPEYLDTRAQVLTKRGEYKAAITDYLQLMGLVSQKETIREKLADLYDKTGQKELAERMRSLQVPEDLSLE